MEAGTYLANYAKRAKSSWVTTKNKTGRYAKRSDTLDQYRRKVDATISSEAHREAAAKVPASFTF